MMIVTKNKKRNKSVRRAFVYIRIRERDKSSELNSIDAFLSFITVEQHQLEKQKV